LTRSCWSASLRKMRAVKVACYLINSQSKYPVASDPSRTDLFFKHANRYSKKFQCPGYSTLLTYTFDGISVKWMGRSNQIRSGILTRSKPFGRLWLSGTSCRDPRTLPAPAEHGRIDYTLSLMYCSSESDATYAYVLSDLCSPRGIGTCVKSPGFWSLEELPSGLGRAFAWSRSSFGG